ncbi:glycoside hydrolase family protein [Hymenobacter arcticus]
MTERPACAPLIIGRLGRGRGATLLLGACLSACNAEPPARLPPAPHTAQVAVRPYPAAFGYGCNLGYYGPTWPDEQLARAVHAAGGNTIRVTLPEQFLVQWGWDVRKSTFSYYTDSLKFSNLTCFVGDPSPAHRDPVVYPGCPEPSHLFANLYEPIWNADSTVNPKNYYAQYIYQLTQRYGRHVRVWEVVNEPDYITGTLNRKWLDRAPAPAELPNVLAPIGRYIRTLRITWEVVKKYQPTAYVAPGGLGYPEFLDALLRYSDNPRDGAPNAEYPATGGAYFDVLDYHVYPSYDLRRRDWQRAGRFAYTRNSDFAAEQVIAHQQAMAAVLHKYGYDGTAYPRKHFLVSETNVGRRPADWRAGSDELQRNFGLKALVLAQQAGITQLHFYRVGEGAVAPPPGEAVSGDTEFQLMGLYESLTRDPPGRQKLTELGQALRTSGRLLAGRPYDAAGTAALHLPPGVAGAAFGTGPGAVLVLWAQARADQSEAAAATYPLPAAWQQPTLTRYAWNHVPGAAGQPCPGTSLALTGTPAFFARTPLGQ